MGSVEVISVLVLDVNISVVGISSGVVPRCVDFRPSVVERSVPVNIPDVGRRLLVSTGLVVGINWVVVVNSRDVASAAVPSVVVTVTSVEGKDVSEMGVVIWEVLCGDVSVVMALGVSAGVVTNVDEDGLVVVVCTPDVRSVVVAKSSVAEVTVDFSRIGNSVPKSVRVFTGTTVVLSSAVDVDSASSVVDISSDTIGVLKDSVVTSGVV